MIIIDKRSKKYQNSNNRQKFLERHKRQVNDAIDEAMGRDLMKDLKGNAKRIKLKGVTEEPEFRYDRHFGDTKEVLPGNKKYKRHDVIESPKKQKGKGGGTGPGEDGQGAFEVILSEPEFWDRLFTDLELPNYIKKNLQDRTETKRMRGGYCKQAPPPRLDIKKTLISSIGRRLSAKKMLEQQGRGDKRVPFLSDVDLRYRQFIDVPDVSKRAVIVNIMDVSGSMMDSHRNMSKSYFTLLSTFLNTRYKKVEYVWITHTSEAYEVDEKEFFYGNRTGGTQIAPALDLAEKIIKSRYDPEVWNIYISHVSDGDIWGDELQEVFAGMGRLTKLSSLYTYIQMDPPPTRGFQGLIRFLDRADMEGVKIVDLNDRHKLRATICNSYREIWEFFKKLFARGPHERR